MIGPGCADPRLDPGDINAIDNFVTFGFISTAPREHALEKFNTFRVPWGPLFLVLFAVLCDREDKEVATLRVAARVLDGGTVVVLLAMALLLGAALVLSFLHWKDWKAGPTSLATARGARHTAASTNTSSNVCEGSSREGTTCQKPGLKKAKPLDGLLREDGVADAQSAREFRTVFNMTSQASREAMIENWMRRKGCSRSEAMRLAVEEWRRDNR